MNQTKRNFYIEIGLVLGVSLGASMLYSIVSLLEKVFSPAGLGGSSSDLNPSQSTNQIFDVTYQLLGIGLALVPVALAVYFLHQSDKDFRMGAWPIKINDTLRAIALAAAVGIPGLALYFAARALNLSSQVIPSSENTFWYTIPVLLLAALRSGIQEEVIMLGFLYKRLEQLGFSFAKQQLISSAIRAGYHLYQGVGGAVGNFALGLIFGWCYRRWGRVAPLVIAHTLMDAVVFIGYIYLGKLLS